MNWIPAILILCFSSLQGPQVKKLDDQSTIEIFNSIDNFKQYHTSNFKVNLFRTTGGSNLELTGYPLSSYIVGIRNYSEPSPTQLFKIGHFYEPQIIETMRQRGGIKISIDHGQSGQRISSTFMITKDRVERLD